MSATPSRSRGLSKRGRETYGKDKPPVFTLVDCGTDQQYVIPAKSADESTVRLLLDNYEEESLTVYTEGFRAYDPLKDDEDYHREAVIHSEGECVDEDAHVNTCESHASLVRRWLSPHRGSQRNRPNCTLTYQQRASHERTRLNSTGYSVLTRLVTNSS